MDPERLEQIQELFHAALERPPPDRGAYLDEACRGDRELRAAVERYLAADADDFSLLDETRLPLSERLLAIEASRRLERLRAALAERYTIEREIGAGGMATVYLAQDLKHDRKVAVKVLRPELTAVLGAERFLQEIKVTANLQHPGILPLYDSGEAGPFLYYVTPFVDGGSLRAKLRAEGTLGIAEVLEFVKPVAAALQYAHERDVVHRDIKPGNILLQAGQPLLADFGIALAVSQAGGARASERARSPGTPRYMSPEQASADCVVDGRSDTYSLACVVYEMLSGGPPFQGATTEGVIGKHRTAPPPDITAVRPDLDPSIGAALSRTLRKVPEERFASAQEFAEALTASGAPRGSRNQGSRIALVAMIATGTLAVVIAAAISAISTSEPDSTALGQGEAGVTAAQLEVNPGWGACEPGGGHVTLNVDKEAGTLEINVQLEGFRPNTEYQLGVNEHRGAEAFGGLPFQDRATYTITDCDSGVTATSTHSSFLVGSVTTDRRGNGSHHTILSIASGVYEIQFGIARPVTRGLTYYKTGNAFGSTVTVMFP